MDLSPVDPREILLPAVRCLSNFTGEGIVEAWGGPTQSSMGKEADIYLPSVFFLAPVLLRSLGQTPGQDRG